MEKHVKFNADIVNRINFGQNLKTLRKLNGVSQTELAELLGVHFLTVSRWETSVNFPDIRIIALLTDLFNVSCDYLIGLHHQGE